MCGTWHVFRTKVRQSLAVRLALNVQVGIRVSTE